MDIASLPENTRALKQLIADLLVGHETVIAEREATISGYKADIADKDQYISQLEEQVRLLKALQYAAKSEKTRPHHGEEQYSLFDEAEWAAMREETGEAAEEPRTEVVPHARRKAGSKPIPEAYPRVEVVHDIPEQDKICGCGAALTRIGEEVSEKLDIVPAKIQVIRHVRPKYACRTCEGVEDDGPTVRTAPMPPQLIPGGMATAGLVAYVVVNKFVDGLPFYRQERMFSRLGLDISRATMCNWALQASRACGPLVDALHKEIRSGPLINMDETTVQVMKEPGRKNTAKSQMWVVCGGPSSTPVVLFHYDPSRSGKVAEDIVGNFQGYLQTDGYAGYNALGAREDITHLGCLAHVRRKFHDVLKTGSKKKAGTAETVVNLIGKLYKLEKQAREGNLDFEEIRLMRQEKIRPILDKIKILLLARGGSVPPKSLLGKAMSYALGQWDRIEAYLQDGRLSPDNNAAENAIRPFAVGRKNWLFSGSPRGCKASAALYSLVETAKVNGLNPYEYLLHVFEQIPHVKGEEDIKALLPWALKKEGKST
ncbi:MAG: IS66 family transposase [Proteobacteria bacterium]|nr:IS66 family transposase [Pseudomonadota bacterium]MBU1612025.1 IS66 family transposase [Pseudomonadota bacterium]